MKPMLCAGMVVRHAGQVARIVRVWDEGDGAKLDIVYQTGTWHGLKVRVDPAAIEQVIAVAQPVGDWQPVVSA